MLSLNELSLILFKSLKLQTGLAFMETKKFHGNKAFLKLLLCCMDLMDFSVYNILIRLKESDIMKLIIPQNTDKRRIDASADSRTAVRNRSKDSKFWEVSKVRMCVFYNKHQKLLILSENKKNINSFTI